MPVILKKHRANLSIMKKIFYIFFLSLFSFEYTYAAHRVIHLTIGYKTVHFAGKSVNAIAVNHQIPGPTLHFKQGDDVTINVYNTLNEETAIHWHGILVPWQMDGVLGVTQHGIQPGSHFQYHFKLMQAGTYWYHSHSGLQEQQGLYGALIIDPPQKPIYQYNKDYVIVLSDWSNTHPEHILANLKKDGDYYSPNFPLQPSLTKFIRDYQKADANERINLIDDYKMMQQMRMSIYDINDIAYDAFLLNGGTKSHPWIAPVKTGDVVRLRFIGASAETIFRVKIPGAHMRIVHVEGNDIKPYDVNYFSIAPGETYDVIVKINQDKPYIIYAESSDTVGVALGVLTTHPNQSIHLNAIQPFPEPKPVTRDMMENMMHDSNHSKMNMTSSMKMTHMDMNHDMNNEMHVSHMHMNMPTEPNVLGDTIFHDKKMHDVTFGTKYQNLIAKVRTNNPNKSIAGIIKLELFGYMNHFIWMINGLTEYQAKPILLQPGKRYRIIFINDTMMYHPMHIHGHWFILRNGHGAYDPLLHTIEIPPGSTVVADVDTDASGQWFFHCHMIYHMASGMSRIYQYSTLIDIINNKIAPQHTVKYTQFFNRPIVRVDEIRPIDLTLVDHPMGHHAGIWLSTFLDIGADPFHNTQRLSYKGLYGSDYNKLELFSNDAEIKKGKVDNADLDIFYWHLISQFWSIKGGANYFYRPAMKPYWQPGFGLEGLMPYFIDTDVRGYYHRGSAKLDIELSRDTQITNNFLIRLGIRGIVATKTVMQDSIGSGLNQMRYIVRPYYRLMPGFNIFAEYENQQNYGQYKNFIKNSGENTMTLGFTVMF